jgi:nonribosomal peptide synthetase protein VioO
MTIAANIDDLDRPADVVGAFFAAARANPHRPAIAGNGCELCYGELERSVLDLARRLGPDCGVVGVLVTRSANTIVALLGTLAAGGSYCPIDPTFPLERQRALLHTGGARLVIATAPGQRNPSDLPLVELPGVAAERAVPGHALADGVVAAAEPDRPAYLLFTSGSTGEPKGVLTPRRALDAAVGSLRELFAITPADRVLQFASLNWDTCFEEILPALTGGAALVIDDEAYTGSMPRLLRMVARERVTLLDLPTAFWHELVNYLGEERGALPASVRAVIIGGEAARPARLAEWRTLDTSGIRLVNTYGATETTLVTHALDLHGPLAEPSEPDDTGPVPIGRRLPHVTEHIGEGGELFVGGPALALGYLGLPDVSAARFPLLDLGDGPRRYFRSGDRVSRSASGALVYRGRLDNQLKIRGIRVDLGELEAALARHSGVAAVAVSGVSVADHTALAAYVVPRSSADARTLGAALFAELRARVPAHLVPASIHVVSDFVYTASGKVDRAGLHRRHAASNFKGAHQ